MATRLSPCRGKGESEEVGGSIGSTGAFKILVVLGSSVVIELNGDALPTPDSTLVALVEAPDSPVSSSSISIAKGSSGTGQQRVQS